MSADDWNRRRRALRSACGCTASRSRRPTSAASRCADASFLVLFNAAHEPVRVQAPRRRAEGVQWTVESRHRARGRRSRRPTRPAPSGDAIKLEGARSRSCARRIAALIDEARARHAVRRRVPRRARRDSASGRRRASACAWRSAATARPHRSHARRFAGGWHELAVPGRRRPDAAYAFRVRGGRSSVPDPASRSNPWRRARPSVVVDPRAYEWHDDRLARAPVARGGDLPSCTWARFTARGTFAAAVGRLD